MQKSYPTTHLKASGWKEGLDDGGVLILYVALLWFVLTYCLDNTPTGAGNITSHGLREIG